MAHWPQWLTIVWLLTFPMGHAFGAAKKKTAYEAWLHFVVGLLRCILPMTVLTVGGFFAPIGFQA